MEQEQILTTLTEQLGNTSLSSRTISDYVANTMPADGSEYDFAAAVKVLKSLNGQYSHDLADAIGKLPKNGNSSLTNTNQNADSRYNDLVAKLAKLTDDQANLVARLNKRDEESTRQQLVADIKAKMRDQGATDDYVLTQTLKGAKIDAKKSINDLTADFLKAYDEELTACRGKGATPRNGGESEGGNKSATQDFFARKKAKEGWGKPNN